MSPTIMYVVLHVLGLGLSIATLALTVVPGVHILSSSIFQIVTSSVSILYFATRLAMQGLKPNSSYIHSYSDETSLLVLFALSVGTMADQSGADDGTLQYAARRCNWGAMVVMACCLVCLTIYRHRAVKSGGMKRGEALCSSFNQLVHSTKRNSAELQARGFNCNVEA